MVENIIELKNVSINFRLCDDKVLSLKEFITKSISKKISYSEFWALKDINFNVKRGEVLGIIGHNGSGKSTLLKIISGIMKPTTGSVNVNGNIVPMLELGSGFDMDLNGRENIFLNGAILGYSKSFLESKYDEIVEFSELGEFIETPIRNYSSGMMMRLAFSIATVVIPDILIVDEILSVGDEAFQQKSKKRMKELMSGGTTVLFVSHSKEQIKEMCNRVLWLDHGNIHMLDKCEIVCDKYTL
ncbi:ABC transporter ATP-binding protein [Clostridium botulinum]|uniref:ABC transporter ATP-binding protein n=1 Tax=Clostridium botulinum TaxID=1491 RepID=UPI0007740E47|nr:ABC transporter ATP-binding protein [Clostridium botulinum]MBN1049914.1 ABC transporter ATP-binding protein [Clostridium botulinum]MBN1059843.1 ABC transporter ATP-binding protein [Clostridium botulinum]MBN1062989.1 ABC transporter ATP-binding protein [Clostridium botulinum]MCS6111258.1 ABC transporter ATP-binding protein [Clostridium botulinum]NFE10847.1 ABC transporter ATP-binding protein [Clostridium botulinum]